MWDGADILASAVAVVIETRAALAAAQRGGRLTGDEGIDPLGRESRVP